MPADVAVIVIKQQIKACGFRGRLSFQWCRRLGFSPCLLPNMPDTHGGGWPPRVLHTLPPPSPCGALRGIRWAAAGSPRGMGMLRGLQGPSRVLVLGRTPAWPGTSLQGAGRRAAVTCGGAGAASCAGAELGPEQRVKEGTESPRCRGAAGGAGAVSPRLGVQVPSCTVPQPLAVPVAPTEPCQDICPRDPCPFPFPQQDGTPVTGTERRSER